MQKTDKNVVITKACYELKISESIYKNIVIVSFEQSDSDLNALESAFNTGNIDDIQEISHRLKGVYLNLRIDAIGSLAEKINDMAKEKKSIGEMESFFIEMKNNFEEIRKLFVDN